MILKCENCNARYLVPDTAIGSAGRTVRCARCSHTWFETPPAGKSEENIPDFDMMIGEINQTPKPLPEGSNLPAPVPHTSVTVKAAFTALLFCVALVGAFMLKPAMFGAGSSKGLVLADVELARKTDDKDNIAEISGNILNQSDETIKVPKIRVTLLDGGNNTLQSWEFSGLDVSLKPGETLPFSTSALDIKFSIAKRFVVDLGTPFELALRRKP